MHRMGELAFLKIAAFKSPDYAFDLLLVAKENTVEDSPSCRLWAKKIRPRADWRTGGSLLLNLCYVFPRNLSMRLSPHDVSGLADPKCLDCNVVGLQAYLRDGQQCILCRFQLGRSTSFDYRNIS
jgi:hypothetical protein